MVRYCGDCAYLSYGQGKCPILNVTPDEDQTACPMFSTRVITCSICGKALTSGVIVDCEDEQYYYTCGNCVETLGTCGTCKYATGCAFKEDQSCAEPPYVMATMRQGNTVIQQQVPNPKRVQALCPNCPCYSPNGCKRCDGGTCELYKTNRKES